MQRHRVPVKPTCGNYKMSIYNGCVRPPQVREVSNRILATTDRAVINDTEFSHMTTLFGQWNDHDLTFTPFSPSIRSFSNGLDCNEDCERAEPCFPIEVWPPAGFQSELLLCSTTYMLRQ